MADDDSLSQDDIDELLNLGEDSAAPAGQDDELNLDSLLSDDDSQAGSGGGSIDQDALDALSGMVDTASSADSFADSDKATAVKSGSQKENIDLLLDVFVRFTVELGRTKMLIKDVMLLGEGSVVELDKTIGDEVDILVNDRLFGRGRLVIVDEYFGIQITQIIDPMESFRGLL
ncbi:MAG: flagellar motor switch protein FliN [Spirochaetia bacterium]|nr:flagellar motor switch protein FliN [Spirochaetia bacterium]